MLSSSLDRLNWVVMCKYHWRKLSFVIFVQLWDIQSLWRFMALWLPCRIDDDVEYAHNQSIICLVVCSTHGHCHNGMRSVFPPHYGIWDAIVWNEDASMISWCSLLDGRLYWWSEGHVEHIFVGVEDNHCCICQFLLIRSILPKSGSLCQLWHLRSLLLWCCRNNTIHNIVELSFDFIWLVIVIAYALMIVLCWLSDKGSFNVIRRSMPFGRPESLPTRPVLLLLPASPLSCVHSKRICSQHQLIPPTSARRVSLRAAVFCICRVLYQQELLQTVVYLTQHCPSACPHPVSRLSKVLLLFLFFFVTVFLWSLTGISLIAV